MFFDKQLNFLLLVTKFKMLLIWNKIIVESGSHMSSDNRVSKSSVVAIDSSGDCVQSRPVLATGAEGKVKFNSRGVLWL